ncbi:transposase-like protein [Paraburkholderia caledonica]|uniref:Transposase-like protein n=1 Tax=Paraburkholderia caledonica TaxID=134536 RepID=A0AB73IR10_9BURK|nr:transposase-like protein [Paraburkholderia caledonica]
MSSKRYTDEFKIEAVKQGLHPVIRWRMWRSA